MYRVLVADDFLPDRAKLIDMLNALTGLDIVVSGSAENDRRAIEIIAEKEPDIVITDVEMPVCDGFELAKYVRVNHPNIRIIFCSLYDVFEYAQKAMFLGGYGYLLKPIDPEQLRQCLVGVMGNIESELVLREQSKAYNQTREILERYKPVMADHFMYILLLGMENGGADLICQKAKYLGIPLLRDARYCILYLEIDGFDRATAAQSPEQREILSIKIGERIREILSGADGSILARIDESHFAYVLQSAARDDAALRKTADDCCDRLLMGFRKSDLSVTMAVSGTAGSIAELRNLYEYCASLMKYKFTLGGGKIIRGGDIPFANTYPDINFNLMIKEVRRLLNSSAPEEIGEYLNELFAKPPALNDQYLKNMCFMLLACAQIILGENNESLIGIVPPEMLTLENLNIFETFLAQKQWIDEVFHTINERLAQKARTKNRQIVDEIIRYIENNYVKNINLEIMAADLYYSANYLNRIFKMETGDTIFDYATKYRIEKAKALLSDHRYKLYEVTAALGYSNPAYFSSVFKKYTGMTPKEFRERSAT